MYVLHKSIISDITFTLLVFTLEFFSGIQAGYCDGKAENQMITEKPFSPLYVVEYNNASLTWSYCKANKIDIKGFIIYYGPLSSYSNKRPLMSIGITGKVYKSKNLLHDFAERLELWKEDDNITFRIINTTIKDSGTYRLEIRKRTSADLFSQINIQVIKTELTTTEPSHIPRTEAQENDYTTDSVYNQKAMPRQSEQRNMIFVIISVIITMAILILVVIATVMYIKKVKRHKICGDGILQLPEDSNTLIGV